MINSLKYVVTLFLGIVSFNAIALFELPSQELRWDWNAVNLDDKHFWDKELSFPNDFVLGVAASAYQNEGPYQGKNEFGEDEYCDNNWTIDQSKINPGKGCDHWDRYKEDVQLMKKIGIKAYRFSVEWAKIEPQPGIFNQKALDHYKDLCIELKKNGIEPIICLFHFTWPVWFDQKGGFAKTENMADFVAFSVRVFTQLHHYCKNWISFNEPTCFACEGYFRGKLPPCQQDWTLYLSGLVMKNMLNTHVELYKIFKKIDPSIQFGIVNIMQLLDPYHPWNVLEQTICRGFSYVFIDSIINFFKTGKASWGLVSIDNPDAPSSLDYYGVNYYSHSVIKQKFNGLIEYTHQEEETIGGGDSGKALYPEGLYRCIQKVAALNVPIIVGENGIADKSDCYRNDYIKKHLYAVSRAMKEITYDDNTPIKVMGYFYWTPFDNFNWNKGFTSKYGLYEVDFDTFERRLRDGAKPFANFMLKRSNRPAIA